MTPPFRPAPWATGGHRQTLLGWWLDKKLGTNPWLVVTGSLFGIGAGFYAFFKALTALGKKK